MNLLKIIIYRVEDFLAASRTTSSDALPNFNHSSKLEKKARFAMTLKNILCSTIFLIGTGVETFAASAPPAALNKTIKISFSVNGTSVTPDGTPHAFNTLILQTMYISSAGRVFSRQSISALRGRRSRQVEAAPDQKSNSSFQFNGNTLVGQIGWASGARQITATFDAGFTSCSASVIEGKQNGELIKRRGPSGSLNTITASSISNTSCSIESGNAFSG